MAIDTIARALSGQANATAADAKTTAEQAVSTAIAAVPAAVTSWLDANVDPVGSAVVVDSSLTIAGAAADAKATGEAVTDLKNELSFDEYLINAGLYSIKVSDLESGVWNYSTKVDNAARARIKNLLPVRAGMTINYTVSTYDVYFGVLAAKDSPDYSGGQSGTWKTSSGSLNITANGFLVFNIRNHTNTSATFDPATWDGTVDIITQDKDILEKAVITRGVLASGTDLDTVKTPGIWVLSSGYSYAHTPIPAGYGGMFLVFPATANSIGQIAYVMTSNMTALHYYVRSAISGSFLAWKQIDESGDTYNNTYTTEYYDNTYNITCSPTITTDTNNYLASTGDYTDRTGDIQTMLNSTGVCHLGPGRFSVTGVEIPSYGALIGSGPRTVLILDASVTDGYAVKLKTQSAVSDMRITSVSAPELSQNVGTRHGVLFEGTADAQTSPQTFQRSRVSGCIISNFTGGGITCRNTGLSPASSLVISDCQIFSCNAGVNISFFSEFHRITNVTAQECYYGCVCNGGNNNFANCDFSANKMALLIDNSTGQSRNNTHGTFSACSFHHSDNTYENGVIVSVGTAIRILGASAGEIFTGCQIGYGNLEIDDSVGIRFDACNFLRMTALGITDSPLVVFSECTFYDANSSPLTQSGNTTLKFADCYLRNGSVYNPMA